MSAVSIAASEPAAPIAILTVAAVIAGATPIGIPMAPGVDSLNVAVTAGIVLHHLKLAQA